MLTSAAREARAAAGQAEEVPEEQAAAITPKNLKKAGGSRKDREKI
jgi:hypothetical protein